MNEPNNIEVFPWQGSLLDTIRVRPAMYIGESSLTGLSFFLQGVREGARLGQAKVDIGLPSDFADWVAYRLHLSSKYSGFWHKAILDRIGNEKLALDRFFELRDEYFQRQATTVATIRQDCREYKAGHMTAEGRGPCNTELLPASLRIVVYTDDPGFFLVSDEPKMVFVEHGFYAALSSGFLPIVHRFEVCDEATWNRLLAEDKRYKEKLARTRATSRRKREAAN